MSPSIGSVWSIRACEWGEVDEATREVEVCAVETNHVLVEYRGELDRWGGPRRAWVPLALWTGDHLCVTPLVGGCAQCGNVPEDFALDDVTP